MTKAQAQVSKCPFHAAQQRLLKSPLKSTESISCIPTATAKPIPTMRTHRLLQGTQWALNPVGYVQKNFDRHGDVFRANITSNKSYCLVSEPKIIQYLFSHDTSELSALGELNDITEPLIGQKNIIRSSGKQHRSRRKVVMPPLRHQNCLSTYSQIIEQVTQDVIDQWQVGDSLDVRIEMQKITTRVILKVVLGIEQGDHSQTLECLLNSLLNTIGTPISSLIMFVPWLRKDVGSWSPGGRIRQLTEEIDKLLYAEIEQRRAGGRSEEMDVLSLLLEAKNEEGNHLSNHDLRDELMMLLIAGFETTTIALTWALYWTHLLPEVKQNLLSALSHLPGAGSAEQMLSLPYLSAVCNETLRINPIVMLTFARKVEVPLRVGGYQFSPGDLVMGSIYSLHRREDLYPQPHRFRPERFLERQFSPYEFMPFGGGARRCIGSALAQCEMKVVLATILRQVDLSLISNCPIKQARRGIISGPKSPVRVQLKRKHYPFVDRPIIQDRS